MSKYHPDEHNSRVHPRVSMRVQRLRLRLKPKGWRYLLSGWQHTTLLNISNDGIGFKSRHMFIVGTCYAMILGVGDQQQCHVRIVRVDQVGSSFYCGAKLVDHTALLQRLIAGIKPTRAHQGAPAQPRRSLRLS
ncbi:hypothetical protein EZV61_07185 [Corallincola luteus]|uniref:PilZ domain-containing protein n=2 Tax=Corallincola TaxID=1775176 RepID=A0ABY1WP75_9GAMM|nr:hypothetical protein [Corallincola luteus]TAA45871.1 hypothetical protein EXY25_10980 [Corallincola spongiicola]TCI03972.1 hypothetical protein EZV61_07185 [Corallincola luteus]